MLLVSTPIGVVWGVVEAARFHPGLAVLMSMLVSVVGALFWMTVARIRRERALLSPAARDAADVQPVAAPASAAEARPAHRS
jgi:uncharacterized membrane protein